MNRNIFVVCSTPNQFLRKRVKSLSCVRLFVTPCTIAYQAPPSMGFSRQEYFLRNYTHFIEQRILTITLYSLDFYDLRMSLTWNQHTQFSSKSFQIVLPHCWCPGHIIISNCSFLLPFLPSWKVRLSYFYRSSVKVGFQKMCSYPSFKQQFTFYNANDNGLGKHSHSTPGQSYLVRDIHTGKVKGGWSYLYNHENQLIDSTD